MGALYRTKVLLKVKVLPPLEEQNVLTSRRWWPVGPKACYQWLLAAGWTQRLLPVVIGELVRSQIFVKSIVVSEFVCGHQVPSKDHLGPTYLHIS